MSTRVVSYRGRLPGPTEETDGEMVDDSLSGPETVARVLSADVSVIADPVSFPWGSAELVDWRRPVVFDLTGCSDDDMVALLPVLAVGTPHDVYVGRDEVRQALRSQLALPDSCLVDTVPDDLRAVAAELTEAKMNDALLREVLAPIIERDLATAAGIGDDCRRPLTVIDVGPTNRWRATFVPEPHHHEMVGSASDLSSHTADIVLIDAGELSAESTSNVDSVLDGLSHGGLVVTLFGRDDVALAGGVTLRDALDSIEMVTGPHRIVEHVWGLHTRPGMPVLGAVLAVRPLGGRADQMAAAS